MNPLTIFFDSLVCLFAGPNSKTGWVLIEPWGWIMLGVIIFILLIFITWLVRLFLSLTRAD